MSILLIGENRFSQHLQKSLSNQNLTSDVTSCIKKAAELMQNNFYKVIVCTVPYMENDSEKMLDYLKNYAPTSNIIFLAEDMRICKAIELVKNGLFTCLQKPFLIEDIVKYVNEALKSNSDKKAIPAVTKPEKSNAQVQSKMELNKYVRGKSKKAMEMLNQIELVGPTNFSVIIYGETGTGKESVAERLYDAHGGDNAFVAVDCGCLSRELAASELFGHEKGAFTGALHAKKGAFERAHNGTLFLDEVGNLDYEVQTYLLRAIQERKIKKVGGDKEIAVNVRIIVASNENLAEKVKKGEFREDLYHRLNEFEITIPPLRERKEDLSLFIKHFINRGNADLEKNVLGIDNDALKLLKDYNFPGNIRELKNIIRRACLMTPDNHFISLEVLPLDLIENPHPILTKRENEIAETFVPTSIKEHVEKVELNSILTVLESVNFNKSKAATLLNIDRKTLYNKLKKFQMAV